MNPRNVELMLRFPQGGLSASLRSAVVDAVRNSNYLRVWIDEAVYINTGAIGLPALDANFVVHVAEGVSSGVLTMGIIAAAKQVFKVLSAVRHRTLSIKVGDRPSVIYQFGDEDIDQLFESIPNDYERTVGSEITVRRWNNGRWEIVETRRESGGPMGS